MKILVTGSRTWTDLARIRETLTRIDKVNVRPEPKTLIHGNAQGADKGAAIVAKELKWKIISCPAKWENGKQAGLERNIEMLDMLDSKEDIVVAFWDGKSRGTKHTIHEAGNRNLPLFIIGDVGTKEEPQL